MGLELGTSMCNDKDDGPDNIAGSDDLTGKN